MLKYRGIGQGSAAWHEIRLGIVTASRFKDVLAKGQGKTRISYMRQLAGEIITGEREDGYTNKNMEWGTETEDQARAFYELDRGEDTDQVDFISGVEGFGCSPDSLVREDGLLEIKCPKTTTQIETYLSGKMPACHKAQVQGQMWVSERDWCDFVSFDPRINGKSFFFCVRIQRDQTYIDNLIIECNKFKYELDDMVSMLG